MYFLNLLFVLAFVFSWECKKHETTVDLNFDDLPLGDAFPLPENYKGFQWSEYAWYVDSNTLPGTGYEYGAVSKPNVLFSAWENPFSVSLPGCKFSIRLAYFTAAWESELSLTVTGSLNGEQVFTESFMAINTKPTFKSFDYGKVDQLTFSSSGVRDGSGIHFVVDNLRLCVEKDAIMFKEIKGKGKVQTKNHQGLSYKNEN
jgi:hypothetical protein